MAMVTGYFEVSVNFDTENRTEKFMILIRNLYPIYRILIGNQFLLYFLRKFVMSIVSNI